MRRQIDSGSESHVLSRSDRNSLYDVARDLPFRAVEVSARAGQAWKSTAFNAGPADILGDVNNTAGGQIVTTHHPLSI